LRKGEIEKGRPTYFPIGTRRPALPIISSLKALSARRLFHPRTPVRSFVSLLGACPRESGAAALVLARLYSVTPGRFNCKAAWQEASHLLPEMILRLRWTVVNAKKVAEVRSSNQTSSGGAVLESPFAFQP